MSDMLFTGWEVLGFVAGTVVFTLSAVFAIFLAATDIMSKRL
jgi:hypothetical protein